MDGVRLRKERSAIKFTNKLLNMMGQMLTEVCGISRFRRHGPSIPPTKLGLTYWVEYLTLQKSSSKFS